MKKKTVWGGNFLPWLIPILSLVIIFQAVFLVNRLKRNAPPKQLAYIPAPELQEVGGAAVKLTFAPGGASIRKGETASFDLVLSPKRKLRLDGIRLVLNFDSQLAELTQITTDRLFSSVTQNREGEKEGKILLTFLEENPGGYWLDKGVKLLTLTLKGLKTGESEVAVIVEGEGPQTVITESGSSKKILFDRGNLKLVIH